MRCGAGGAILGALWGGPRVLWGWCVAALVHCAGDTQCSLGLLGQHLCTVGRHCVAGWVALGALWGWWGGGTRALWGWWGGTCALGAGGVALVRCGAGGVALVHCGAALCGWLGGTRCTVGVRWRHSCTVGLVGWHSCAVGRHCVAGWVALGALWEWGGGTCALWDWWGGTRALWGWWGGTRALWGGIVWLVGWHSAHCGGGVALVHCGAGGVILGARWGDTRCAVGVVGWPSCAVGLVGRHLCAVGLVGWHSVHCGGGVALVRSGAGGVALVRCGAGRVALGALLAFLPVDSLSGFWKFLLSQVSKQLGSWAQESFFSPDRNASYEADSWRSPCASSSGCARGLSHVQGAVVC
ncbi:hypothetical protein NDU88_000111 [Pleurodeles waltl]|uniref:Uncharacterized protein n=1 Tax=Pleurodeles waltl TaxID=8319 RepID=A0AAV7NZW2_PLEWA|nr:hypothetical protein NDU88_000111 [Pleurodeles waltl]